MDSEGQAPRAVTYESNARAFILGRDATAQFQLPLATVSRHHARISETDGIYVIEDLGSTHGTRLNGKPLHKGELKVLHAGDVIDMTKVKITCAIESEKVASRDAAEGSQAVAAKAVQGILGRLGDVKGGNPFLRAISGPVSGQRFALAAGLSQWTAGRSQDCEVVIDDVNVSRRHLLIRKDWSGYVVEDLGSKNGVLVNDQQLTRPRRLRHEDALQIGPIKLLFIDPDADLLDALKAVPGFEVEESLPQPEPAPALSRDTGAEALAVQGGDALAAGAAAAAEVAPPLGEGAQTEGVDGAPSPAAAADELADLDPSLLEPAPARQQHMEWALLGGALLVALLAGLGLFLIL